LSGFATSTPALVASMYEAMRTNELKGNADLCAAFATASYCCSLKLINTLLSTILNLLGSDKTSNKAIQIDAQVHYDIKMIYKVFDRYAKMLIMAV
jgi:hypothetical protein